MEGEGLQAFWSPGGTWLVVVEPGRYRELLVHCFESATGREVFRTSWIGAAFYAGFWLREEGFWMVLRPQNGAVQLLCIAVPDGGEERSLELLRSPVLSVALATSVRDEAQVALTMYETPEVQRFLLVDLEQARIVWKMSSEEVPVVQGAGLWKLGALHPDGGRVVLHGAQYLNLQCIESDGSLGAACVSTRKRSGGVRCVGWAGPSAVWALTSWANVMDLEPAISVCDFERGECVREFSLESGAGWRALGVVLLSSTGRAERLFRVSSAEENKNALLAFDQEALETRSISLDLENEEFYSAGWLGTELWVLRQEGDEYVVHRATSTGERTSSDWLVGTSATKETPSLIESPCGKFLLKATRLFNRSRVPRERVEVSWYLATMFDS